MSTDKWLIDHEGNRILADDERATIICYMSASLANPDVLKDAHLIAAAPDMYAALQRLLVEAEAFSSVIKPYGNSEAIAESRAALAKARGESVMSNYNNDTLVEQANRIAELTAREAELVAIADGAHEGLCNANAKIDELVAEVERLKALNRGMYEAFAKGFTTRQSHGPSSKYEMVTKFHSLADMQAADNAWINTCLAGREVIARNALGEG